MGEVVSLTADLVVTGAPNSSLDHFLQDGWPQTVHEWVDLLRESINTEGRQQYVLFGQPVYLFGLLLCCFCLPELVGTHLVSFGMFDMPADKYSSGVKGCVACRFSLFDRSFCFVNVHLEADHSRTDDSLNKKSFQTRMAQMHECIQKIQFQRGDQHLYPVGAHRVVFQLGDTNMRLLKPAEFLTLKAFSDHVHQKVAAGDWRSLLRWDQLTQVLTHSACAVQLQPASSIWWDEVRKWREGTVGGENFPPTYKMQVGEAGWDRKRVPAWTDRILYRSNEVRTCDYGAVSQKETLNDNVTDHCPVYGRFEVECLRIKKSHFRQVLRDRVYTTPQSSSESQFRARVLNSADPHLERLAQRLHALSQSIDGVPPLDAATKILAVQQKCWKYVCKHVGEELQAALRNSNSASDLAVETLAAELNATVDKLGTPLGQSRQGLDCRPAHSTGNMSAERTDLTLKL